MGGNAFDGMHRPQVAHVDGWVAGTTLDDWHSLNGFAEEFHDCVVRECYLFQHEHVDTSGHMVYGDDPAAALFIQSQFPDVGAIELRFEGVRSFSFDPEVEVQPPEVSTTTGGELVIRILSCVIRARSFRWRALGIDAWGAAPFLGRPPIDGDEAI